MECHLITLKEKPERTKRVQKLLRKYNIPHQLHTFSKHSHPIRGCRESHLTIYHFASDNNLPYILVLEDNIIDTQNTRIFHPHLKKIKDFADHNDFDLIYISAFFTPFTSRWLKRERNSFYLLPEKHIVGGMGYLISRRCYKDILKRGCQSAIDRIHSYYPLRYISKPLMFHHTSEANSVTNSKMDRMRELYFSSKVYNKIEKLYFSGWWRMACYGVVLLIGVIAIYLVIRFV